jgi:CHAT domain-containing protein/tetratricopeptide (TPR) repeat protein
MATRSNNHQWLPVRSNIAGGAVLVALAAGCSFWFAPNIVQAQDASAAQLQAQIEKLRGKKITEPLATALCRLAKFYCDEGAQEKAIPLLQEACDLDVAAGRPCAQWQYYLYVLYRNQARKSGSIEQNRQALAQLVIAKDAFVKENRPEEVAQCLTNMGWIERECNNFNAAIEHLTAAVEVAKKAGLGKAAAGAYHDLSATALASGDTAAALKYQQDAIRFLEKSDDQEAVAEGWARLGDLQNRLHRTDEALRSYQKAWEFESRVEQIERNWKIESSIQHGLGEGYYGQHTVQESVAHYQRAIELMKGNEKQDMELWIRAHTNLGISQADLNQLDAAERSQQIAIQAAKQAKLPSLLLEATVQLACNSMLKGRAEQALQELTDARPLVEDRQIGPAERGFFHIMIGRCYRTLGQTKAALKYYDDALREYEQAKDPLRQAEVLSNIAVVYLDTMQKDEFQTNANRANELFTLMQDERGCGIIDFNKAQFAFVCNEMAASIPLYEQAFNKLQNAHESKIAASALRGKGFALLRQHQPEQAAKAFEQSLAMVAGTENLEAQWDCNLGLGSAFMQLKDSARATEYLKVAVDLVEKERQQLTRDSFKTHNLDFRRACYLELADAYLAQNKPYEALEVAEKGKARAFLDLLANRHSRSMNLSFGIPGDTTGGTSTGAGSGLKADVGDKPALVAMAGLPGTRSVQIKAKEHAVIEPTAISPVAAKPPDVGEIKSLLSKRQSTCLEYYLYQHKMVIWVIKPDLSISAVTVPLQKSELAAAVQALHEALLTQPTTQTELEQLGHKRQELLRSLYAKLIAPVAKELPTSADQPVTIIPDQELFMVPFAALMAPDGTYLTEKHTLSYAPAIGVLRSTQQLASENKNEKSLLAFGNPASPLAQAIGLPPLPYAEKEVKNIAQLFGPENTNLKVGPDATKSAFALAAPAKSCLHLATHGLVDEEQPTRSALVLAPEKGDDGMLTVGDILQLKNIKASLIVLSACQTGRGKITGDGVVGLSRAFIIAGTPSVIVSQWNVDDVMTEYLMRKFYEEYLSGKPKAQSLRNAQIAALKALERNRTEPLTPSTIRGNPRFWAAFQIIGEQK